MSAYLDRIETIGTKTCRACGKVLPISVFRVNKNYSGICPECRANRPYNLRIKKTDCCMPNAQKLPQQNSALKKCPKCGGIFGISSFRMNGKRVHMCTLCHYERRIRIRAYSRTYNYDRRQGLAGKAQSLVTRAIRAGRLIKTEYCQICGCVVPADKLHGHHADYNYPLSVIWLCPQCHAFAHKMIREIELLGDSIDQAA